MHTKDLWTNQQEEGNQLFFLKVTTTVYAKYEIFFSFYKKMAN